MQELTQLDGEPEEETVLLGDAALLTKGSSNNSVEAKRSPYDA
ncbi:MULTISPECIES: albusnodin family lasso peptide [Kitasatospora]|nr:MULTISPECIES: albusnodin family lasso peptide [Kitasatospora]QKW21106.1 albusnodin family lasso peptide [Kitasatospora sp. NA04385]